MLASFTVIEKTFAKYKGFPKKKVKYFSSNKHIKMKTMSIWLFPRVQSARNIATLQTLYLPGTAVVIEGLHFSKEARRDFASYFSVNKSLLHIFWWIRWLYSVFTFPYFFFFLTYLYLFLNCMLISATSTKGRPFKGKRSS